MLSELHQEHILQLQRRWSEKEMPRLAINKKLASLCRSMSYMGQIRNLYGKMVKDLGRELERSTCHCPWEVLS